MDKYIKVANSDGLFRDMLTGAIINNNTSEYEKYIKQRDNIKSQKDQIAKQTQEINTIKEDLCEIRELLISLIEKNSIKG